MMNKPTFMILGDGQIAERLTKYVRGVAHVVEHQRTCDFRGFRHYKYDYLLSINNTILLSKEDVEKADKLSLNMHPAPLPEYAGLYCHYWAIENKEKHFGATVHVMNGGIDTGAIVAQERFKIKEDDMPSTLFIRAMDAGFRQMCVVVNSIVYDELPTLTKQDFSKRKLYTRQMAQEAGFGNRS